jgi:hypothetical protein
VRIRAPADGGDVTTSGSLRVFSACSSMVTWSRRVDRSIGLEKTRRAWAPHRSQVIDSGAVPSGNLTSSNTPSLSHRYSYVVTRTSFRHSAGRGQFAELGTSMSCLTWCGLALDGATSKSNIALGIYTVAHEFGMSTTPENRPSIGAEPRIM